ncbi:MAG: GHKL domain-containing protein [Bacillota bacterium]|nr:GHKL domain-containing protein [Bacillota bacterium]
MMLLLDYLYAFIESMIYVMYLNIFLKNNQDMRVRNTFLVLLLFVIAFVFNHSFLYLKILLSIIISCIYARHFYKETFLSQFIKILGINFNMVFINELCIFLMNHEPLAYSEYINNHYFGYLIAFMSFVILMIEYLYLKKYLDKEFQLSGYMWHFIATVLVGVIFLDIFIFNDYIKSELNVTLVSYVFFISFLVIILIYVVCIEMTHFYQNLMNEKIHIQALRYEETLVDVIGQKMQEYNKVVHDYRKLLNAVKDHKSDEELRKIIESISDELPKEVIHTNHIAVNYTMNQYMELSKERQVDFYGTYPQNMKIGMTSYDLLIILESLLENAFYIGFKTNQKSIHYMIENEEYHIIIKIENNCTNDFKWDSECLKRLETIKKICQKYDGKLFLKREETKFVQGCYLQYDEDLL